MVALAERIVRSKSSHSAVDRTESALMVRSFQLSKMLQVAAAFQLADRVAEGPCSVTRLASAATSGAYGWLCLPGN